MVNECELGTDNCDDAHGTCTATAEYFECSCKPGYTGDGVTCTGTITIIRGKVQIECDRFAFANTGLVAFLIMGQVDFASSG